MLVSIMCSCANYKLEKTVWSSVSPAEKDGQRGSVITSLFFTSSDDVDIFKAVIVGDSLAVTPYKYAEGKYEVSGNPKKEAAIKITAKTIQKEDIEYVGGYHKSDAMLLFTQDTIPYLYGIQKNYKIK